MEYLFLKFENIPTDIQDVLVAELYDIGFDSFEQEADTVIAYVNQKLYKKAEVEKVLNQLNLQVKFSEETLPITNWNAAWESNFNPITIDNDLIIRANFHPEQPHFKHQIVITPQMSFGTGHHDTTYLMLKQMLSVNFSNQSVLDVGCGTGILAIFSKLQGAYKVVGVDNDPWAYKNSVSNETENKVSGIHWIEGTIEDVPQQTFDFVIANINKNIILKQLSNYSSFLNPGGTLFLSGFYLDDVHDINQAAYNLNLQLIATHHQNNWAVLQYTK